MPGHTRMDTPTCVLANMQYEHAIKCVCVCCRLWCVGGWCCCGQGGVGHTVG